MQPKVIEKNRIPGFIAHLQSRYPVFGPVETHDLFLFQPIENPAQINLCYSNSKIPPKSFCFPQTETLFRFTTDETVKIKPREKPPQSVIFGIRPCDAKSLKLLDEIFNDDPKDTIYISKRKNMILVGLTCVTPSVNCFCTSLGGSPAGTDGLDVLLTDIGDKYFAEAFTEKGEKLFEGFDNFTFAQDEEKKKKEETVKKACDSIRRSINVTNIDTILDDIFDAEYWETIAKKCLGCGICTFLCPTCHCFDIQDEIADVNGARIRVWDSCMYKEYSLQASGYNPRPSRKNRMRNRIYHKFNYFPKNTHMFGCVGCGRCISECPVNIDIIEIINKAREVRP